MRFHESCNVARSALLAISVLGAGLAITGSASAQVPPNIESELIKIGKIVDPACTAKLYRPLMPQNDITSSATPLYPGITIARDVSFGPDPKDVVDVFAADKGPASRPVLIFVPGGGGDKIEIHNKESNAFYDNIMRWATKNGMVGVNMQRHAGPGWDAGAKDVSHMIQWVQANVAKYHGNPERMFIWAHSAGNMPLGTYIGHPELYGPKGVGVKGVIFMSPAAFDIAPVKVDAGSPADFMKMMAAAGKTCGHAKGLMGSDGALPGKAPGQPGGPPTAGLFGGPPPSGAGGPPAGAPPGAAGGPPPGGPPAGPPGMGPPVDEATLLARSSLPELKKTSAKIMLANAELDIGADPALNNMQPFIKALHDELCKSGPEHCPATLMAKGHSHMSVVFSIDTPDTTVSDPILAWMKSVK